MDADTADAFRMILENQRTILRTLAHYTPNLAITTHNQLLESAGKTDFLLMEPFLCEHDWEDGYSMNGPTKTCKKCGKFMRD